MHQKQIESGRARFPATLRTSGGGAQRCAVIIRYSTSVGHSDVSVANFRGKKYRDLSIRNSRLCDADKKRPGEDTVSYRICHSELQHICIYINIC